MSQSPDKLERPALKITIKLDDGDHTVHMSYGLFSDLQRVCPDPSVVIQAGLTDAWSRDYILRRCLTDSKKMITDEKELIPAEDMTLSDPIQMEKLLNWVAGHLLYFFATSAAGIQKLGAKLQMQIQATPAAPSSPGSES